MGLLANLFQRDRIGADEAWAAVDAGAFLLDVRTPAEFAAGSAPGATLIPVDQLPQRLDELPREKRIVAYCRSGARSGRAAELLREAGFEAVNAGGVAALLSVRDANE